MTLSRRNEGGGRAPGVRPLVGLTILEALRDLDLPSETFEDENLSTTMPRRFGVSRVIAQQIRRYEEAARSRQRMDEGELVDLLRLVTRRPDCEEVFALAGERLAGPGGPSRLCRMLPERVRARRAARDVGRRLRDLFGSPFGEVGGDPLTMETRRDLLVRGDPGGEACVLLHGFLRVVVRRHLPGADEVLHPECLARGGSRCVWRVASADEAVEARGRAAGSVEESPRADREPDDGGQVARSQETEPRRGEERPPPRPRGKGRGHAPGNDDRRAAR